jgi:hypothetical protein
MVGQVWSNAKNSWLHRSSGFQRRPDRSDQRSGSTLEGATTLLARCEESERWIEGGRP